ncbi:prepilin-type N-terminal cleavage/methylation domain-containing protein [Thiomicrorhabdus sp.]|uniref:prepilin-type N-terminal cleavage/methylation domain-containing protein n=1 Tax=Thiomicrorhabdus sp. TaxID=2039724 RepID=UPI002AA613CF|nr:prepilin-type N-terminal cleavage/methylation domain-containing protein [Thiomicrorhabdus sp.]
MQVKNLQAQKGFTLVEIAIVLVIIGLLLGGVLKGQELITSAKIKNDTDSLVGLQASTYAYLDRMGYYPGTLRAATPNNAAVNKTQIVGRTTTSNAGFSGVVGTAVPGNFFEDLATQGFVKDPNIGTKLDENGGFTAGFASAGATGTVPVEANQNYICIDYTAGIANGEEILRGMDLKLDDGNPATGKFRYDTTGAAAAASGCFEM